MTTRSPAPDLVRLVKADDLDDDQIRRLWVPYNPKDAQTVAFFRPSSPMATLILGSKGSGKTHLLKYLAFPVQSMPARSTGDLRSVIVQDGYIGIYVRAGSLNSGRFHGKGVGREAWRSFFSYYIDLWLGQRFLEAMSLLRSAIPAVRVRESEVVHRCIDCFYPGVIGSPLTLRALAKELRRLQWTLDSQVRELAFARQFTPQLGCSPGRVVFGFPQAVSAEVDFMKNLLFSYHMDEYENFAPYQQRYFNTLLREREKPVTFRVGARTYGMKTFSTYSATEELREGAEYESVQLDTLLRRNRDSYEVFAKSLLQLRITDWAGPSAVEKLERLFRPSAPETASRTKPDSNSADRSLVRPHFSRLKGQLLEVLDDSDAETVICALSYPESFLIEKVGIYALYQEFAQGASDLLAVAREIGGQLSTAAVDQENPLFEIRKHFVGDFRAQLLKAARQRQLIPTDLRALIFMSEGLPRVFLTIMKHIFQWTEFECGELSVHAISKTARRRGLLAAADWFRRDIPQAGMAGERIRLAILRLGELFRLNRYADKPFECSLIAFSTPNGGYAESARETIQEAVHRSLLLQLARGERDRNTAQVRNKYHLNRLLCPLFDLPISRRGTARFDAHVTDAVFGTTEESPFNEIVQDWERRLYWPFGRPTKDVRREFTTKQGSLF